jgi:hypothetical protein
MAKKSSKFPIIRARWVSIFRPYSLLLSPWLYFGSVIPCFLELAFLPGNMDPSGKGGTSGPEE